MRIKSHTGVNIPDYSLFIQTVQDEQLIVCRLRFHLFHVVCHFLELCLRVRHLEKVIQNTTHWEVQAISI